MRIIGIDLSTKKIAVSLLITDGKASTFEIKPKGARAADRFRKLMAEFRIQMDRLDVDFVFIEDISFVRNRQSELDLAQVLGGVKEILYCLDQPFLAINNQTIKARFGKTRSAKQDIVVFVEQVVGITGLSEDQADAFLVALYGRSLVEDGTVKI